MTKPTKPRFHHMAGAVVNLDRLLLVACDQGQAVFLFDNGSEVRVAQPSVSILFLAEIAQATGATDYRFANRGVIIPPGTVAPTPEETEQVNRSISGEDGNGD